MEVAGLENRIRNHRRKIIDLEQEVAKLDNVTGSRGMQGSEALSGERETPCAVNESQSTGSRPDLAEPTTLLPDLEVEVQQRLTGLENLAGDLADQRLHLAEQWERLLMARQRWQGDHDAAATGLEALALHLRQQEQANRVRDHILTAGEVTLRQRLDEVLRLRHQLEGCQARLRSRAAAWEGERDRILIDVCGREEMIQRRQQEVVALREKWEKRRRQELARFQAGFATAEKLRQEYAALREEWLRRNELLMEKERDLAEKALAIEQYRQECIGQSPDSPAAAKRLGRLRRHWAALFEAAERTLCQEQQAFRRDMARSEEHHRHIEKLALATADQEAKLASRLTAWEHEQAQAQTRLDQMTRQLESLHSQRHRDEQQLTGLRDEVEHVARLLMEENDLAMVPVVQAA
jgi:hypothetical protein